MRIRLFRPEDLDTIRALTVAAFEAVSIDRNIEKQFGMIHGHDWRWRKARHIDLVHHAADDAIAAQLAHERQECLISCAL